MAGYVWFPGTSRPVRSEGILVLGGATEPPTAPALFSQRVLIGVTPVTLLENPFGTVLWEGDGGTRDDR